MQINRELQAYIENNIFPEYEKNEKGHGIDHIKYVIERRRKYEKSVHFHSFVIT